MESVFLILLIVLLMAALGSGFPVAYALPGSAIITIGIAAITGIVFESDTGAYFAQGDPIQWLNAAITNFRGIYWEVERDTLIAIPLFVFMGIMLQRSKIAEDLLIAMAQLFGPIPGGLGISVVFVGALLAATTGIVGATVIAMGLISLPVMLRNNYSVPLATGTISAAGTLGQIIPPSIVLIILADQLSSATDQAQTLRKLDFKNATGSFSMPSEFGVTSTSAGEMFLGALLPGLVLVGLYMAYILIFALIKPKAAPPVPFEGKYDIHFLKRLFLALVPPLTLIFTVLGSIVMGIATVNQAGAIGALGAMIMAGYRLMDGQKGAFYPSILAIVSLILLSIVNSMYDINIKNIQGEAVVGIWLALAIVIAFLASIFWSGWRAYKIDDTLNDVMIETAKTTALVFIILLGAAMLTAAFRAFGGEDLVREFLSNLPGGFASKFIVVMTVIFVLGFFLDFIEIAVVVVPIIAPILLSDPAANITGVWLGVMIGVNMQTSFLTPPFGFALFYLRGVAPKSVKTLQMYKGVIPFIMLQLVGLGIVGFYPYLVNYLPNRVYLTSETAPPPKSPVLQVCIESYVFGIYETDKTSILKTISTARTLDLSYIPEKQQKAFVEGLDLAETVFDKVANIKAAKAALQAYIPEYRPQHVEVRALQKRIRRIDVTLKKRSIQLRRLSDSGFAEKSDLDAMQQEIDGLNTKKQQISVQIPETWEKARKRYLKLEKAESVARLKYRRTVDDAYEPLVNLQKLINSADALSAQSENLENLRQVIENDEPKQAMKTIKSIASKLGSVAGASAIKSKLNKARRALKGKKLDRAKSLQELEKGLALFATEVEWRRKAATDLLSGLKAYNQSIIGTIGLRQQERLTVDQAKIIATCLSVHKDISLSF